MEQESISKEQEIKSLTHRNGLLEADVEKLEEANKKLKEELASDGSNKTQNESLQRRLQLLEDEAEEADRNMRETNDKYDSMSIAILLLSCMLLEYDIWLTAWATQTTPNRCQGRPLRAKSASS